MARRNQQGQNQKIELSDIVNPGYLQAMHDGFSDEMLSLGVEMATAILDEQAMPITFEFNHCTFCKEVRKTKTGVQQCRLSDLEGIRRAREEFERTGEPKPCFYVCKQGLLDFCAPIVLGTRVIAYFFGGQFRCTCKYGDQDLITPEEPSLQHLVDSNVADASEVCNVGRLVSRFRKTQVLDQPKFDELSYRAESFTRQLNGIVERLHRWRWLDLTDAVDNFREKAAQIESVEELFKLAIDKIPEMVKAKHCSIFTVQQDEKGQERLVLRKTSFPKLRAEENTAYYEKGEGLTGWVWEHERSLRLVDLQNSAELAQYEGLAWVQKYDDSDIHRGFLCVPMFGRNRKVIGVLRVPHKKRGNFDKHDEIFLNFLARHFSWVMECQAAEEKFKLAVGTQGLATAARELASGLSYSGVLNAAARSSIALFGSKGRKHFVNILLPDGKHWRVERIEGDLPLKEDWKDRVFTVRKGISGLAIRERRPILSSDLEGSFRRDEYIDSVKGAISGMSAPIRWGDEVYGTISITSDKKFDFSEKKELRLLESLARLTGAAIKNANFHEGVITARAQAYYVIARAVRHHLLNSLLPIERIISSIMSSQDATRLMKERMGACQRAVNKVQDCVDNLRRIAFPTEPSLHAENLNEIIRSVVETMNDSQVVEELSLEIPDIRTDRFMISLILSELLTNALRHIPEDDGRVLVLDKVVQGKGGKECVVEVSDNGPGIPDEVKEKVFVDGYRLEEETEEGHFGLGLFLTRQLATAVGGNIVEEGKYEEGAKFVLRLPC